MDAQTTQSTLLSVLYMSKASGDMGKAQLGEIERVASALNEKSDISGLLVFNGSNFVQVLEGDADEVDATMERIQNDPRHENIHVLRRSGVRQRECPDWGMRCHFLELKEDGAAEDFAATLPSEMLPDTRLIFTSLASAVGREG